MNVKATIGSLHVVNALVWLSVLTLVAGMLVCGIAGYLGLAQIMAPAWAALSVGGVLLLLAGLFFSLVWRAYFGKPKVTEQEPPPRQDTADQAMRPLLGDEVTHWVNQHRTEVAVVAITAGAVVASSPTLRNLLTKAAGPLLIREAMKKAKSLADD